MLEEDTDLIEDELKQSIKKDALLTVKSLLSSPEQLEQLDIFLAKETKKKAKYEDEMVAFIKNHLENLQSTLKELRVAMAEAGCLHSDFTVVKSLVRDYKNNEKNLEKLTGCSLKVSAMSQTLFWLRQIIDMHLTIDDTKKVLDDMQLLKAHKKLRELENVRDKIFSKHFDKSTAKNIAKTAEKNLLAKNFEPIRELDAKLFEKVFYVIENYVRFCQEEPSLLVTALRIVEREERVDGYWQEVAREHPGGCYVPEGRPKGWASHVDRAITEQLEKKIKEIQSKINFEDKLALTELLELVKVTVVKDLTIFQTHGVRCFPPGYQILARVSSLYHNVVAKTLNSCVTKWGDSPQEVDVVAVLLFVKSYTEEQLFGNPKFEPIVLHTIRNCQPLLTSALLQRLEHVYLVNVCENLTSKVARIIAMEKREMAGESLPKVVDNKYRTLLRSFYDDFVGVKMKYARKLSNKMFHGVFKYGVVAFEQFLAQYEVLFENYVNEQFQFDNAPSSASLGFATFANLFKSESHPGDTAPKFPYFVEYCIAVANNCVQVRESVERLCADMAGEMAMKPENARSKYKTPSEWIGEEFSNRVANINHQIDEFSKKCIVTISNDYFFDLASSFDTFLSVRWQENAAAWSEGFHGSLIVFTELLAHLDDLYHPSITEILDKGIAKRYLTRFLTHKAKYGLKQLTDYGEVIINDGNFLSNFFSEKRSLDTKDVFCYAIVLCASVFKATDQDCALIDAAKILKTYGDFTAEHATALLSKRADLHKDKLNETIRGILEGRRITADTHSGVFSDIILKKPALLL